MKILAPIIIISLLIIQSNEVILAQSNDHKDFFTPYRSEITGGITVHTNGWGAGLRYVKNTGNNSNWIIALEAVNMKHAKESKVFNPYINNMKRYVYGKSNSLAIFRPSVGRKKTIFEQNTSRGTEISFHYNIGGAFGFVKPIYLEIADPSIYTSDRKETSEKFDPEKHNANVILGRSSYFKGINEGMIVSGIHFKTGLIFDYSKKDNLTTRTIETGFAFDGFLKPIEIMSKQTGQQLFFTYYINLYFGKKFV
jgi:hypothetical protein